MKQDSDKVRDYVREGNFRKAMSIAKNFKLGVSKEEHRVLQIANDIYNGGRTFYCSLGIDCDIILEESEKILRKLYEKKENPCNRATR